MATKKKALQAAAGWAASQGGVTPEGVSFDTTNDYLYKSSTLTGATDSKTFTMSCWAYLTETGDNYALTIGESTPTTNNQFFVNLSVNTNTEIRGYNSSGTTVLSATLNKAVPLNTWFHFLISVDLANTSNRYVYINDVLQSPTWGTYTNADITFSGADAASVNVITYATTVQKTSRYAHVYLDYTYRDLSTESNRRLFITDDLKPAANQASLSPILYLPMTDADTAGDNLGTGGDFTVNGTLDTAGRGPNQDNCVASYFDGSADELSITSLSGASDGKVCTFSGSFMPREASTLQPFVIYSSGNRFIIQLQPDSIGGKVRVFGYNSSGTNILFIASTNAHVYQNKMMHIAVSIDMTDFSACKIAVNGQEDTFTSTTFTNDTIDFTSTTHTKVGRTSDMCDIGEVYFDTVYTDLSTDNPFWDADNNRPKPVRQVLDETGNTPLIAMPIEASNAGLNLGTGGDFTVNSGPYTGARGGSEYWARSMVATSNNTYIGSSLSSAVSGASGGSLVVAYKRPTADYFMTPILAVGHSGSTGHGVTDITTIRCHDNGSTMATIRADDGTLMTSTGYVGNNTYNVWKIVFLSLDFTNGTYYITTEGASNSGSFSTGYTFGFDKVYFGWSEYASGNDTLVASAYVADSYIDFSSEANRNLFVDQLGYPKDLTPAIDAGDIPTPVVYMKFDDPDALGTNSGTGGDFTVNGTVTQGADVEP